MKIGAQLYTVRERCQTLADFDETLGKIASIGYEYVQLSGTAAFGADDVKGLIGKHGLKLPLTHFDPAAILEDTESVIQYHKTIGAEYVGLGSMPKQYERTAEGVRRFASDYNEPSERLAAAGLKFMYHNHSFEFERGEDGKRFLDIIAENIPSAGFTVDTYWAAHGATDPSTVLMELRGRVDTIHFKDAIITGGQPYAGQQGSPLPPNRVEENPLVGQWRMAEVMTGNLNWCRITDACAWAGVKYIFVEQDDCYGKDPFDCLKTSYDNLRKAGF